VHLASGVGAENADHVDEVQRLPVALAMRSLLAVDAERRLNVAPGVSTTDADHVDEVEQLTVHCAARRLSGACDAVRRLLAAVRVGASGADHVDEVEWPAVSHTMRRFFGALDTILGLRTTTRVSATVNRHEVQRLRVTLAVRTLFRALDAEGGLLVAAGVDAIGADHVDKVQWLTMGTTMRCPGAEDAERRVLATTRLLAMVSFSNPDGVHFML